MNSSDKIVLTDGITKDMESFVNGMISRQRHVQISVSELKKSVICICDRIINEINELNQILLQSDFDVDRIENGLDRIAGFKRGQNRLLAQIARKELLLRDFDVVIGKLTSQFYLPSQAMAATSDVGKTTQSSNQGSGEWFDNPFQIDGIWRNGEPSEK